MPKAVSLYLPYWSIDLVLRSAGRRDPVLLYVETAGRRFVARCCGQAASAGVRPGMTMAHARALLPAGPVIDEVHEPGREGKALEALARWALRFSPIVAADPPDGLLIDITGCRRLFGDRLPDLIAGAVERLGFAARVAAAPTFACAWAVARYGPRCRAVVTEASRRRVLAGLAVEALRIEPRTADALREVGIERIGHLMDMPRSSLTARLGPDLLRRLDQALGRAPEAIDPVRPQTPPAVERVFAGPVKSLEAIALMARELACELSALLARCECGARRIELRLDRLDAGPLSAAVTLSRPSRDPRHLWSLLRPRVESINLGWGVERVRLAAPRVGRIAHEQARQWSETPPDRGRLDRAFGELLDVLSNRLGPDRVTRIEPVASHMPERAFQLRPAMEAAPASPGAEQPAAPPPDRPSLLLERPEPIEVMAMTPEGPPLWLRWRGREHRVTTAAGPERIAPEWWRHEGKMTERHEGTEARRHEGKGESYARAYGRFLLGRDDQPAERDPQRSTSCLRASVPSCLLQCPTRDYFKIQDECGRWLWIYREQGRNHWFLHGLWA